MSCIMRKPAFCICENKDTDQLRSNCAADQRLCFRYKDSTIPLFSKTLAIFCGCTARFMSELVQNPEDGFPHDKAQIVKIIPKGQNGRTDQLCINMSLVMKKPDFCLCENKDADQLHSNCEADQRLCFRYLDSTIPLLSKSEISSL